MTAIAIQGLCKRFGQQPVLRDLSMRVEAGQVYGFLGENGAGKSTTIRLITGLLRADAGEVSLFGKPLAADRPQQLRQLGALIESPAFYAHLSGHANLDLLRRLRGLPATTIDEVLAWVDLAGAAHKRAGQYSHGMKQRLGIAAALLGRPKLVILDEPTNGLDPAGIRAMRTLIRDLPARWGATVLLSSHLLSEVEQTASHVGILHGGHLLFEGALSDLQQRATARLRLRTQQREQALTALQAWQPIAGDDPETLYLPDQPDLAAKVQAALHEAGVVFMEMSHERPSLEQLYFALTDGGQHVDSHSR